MIRVLFSTATMIPIQTAVKDGPPSFLLNFFFPAGSLCEPVTSSFLRISFRYYTMRWSNHAIFDGVHSWRARPGKTMAIIASNPLHFVPSNGKRRQFVNEKHLEPYQKTEWKKTTGVGFEAAMTFRKCPTWIPKKRRVYTAVTVKLSWWHPIRWDETGTVS